jgi:hypothetical protein
MKFRLLHCLLFVVIHEAQTHEEIHCATVSEHVQGCWIGGGGGFKPKTLSPDLILLLCL